MKPLFASLLGMAAVAIPARAVAQQQPTTVQLPTFSYFSVGTSVSVPDRGSAYLGGVTRASSGRNEFGVPLMPFSNRSIGSERSVSSARVSVYLHDFEAMEEAILRQAAASTLQPRRPVAPQSRWEAAPSDAWQPASRPGSVARSLADIQRERAREQLSREQEAADFFARGRAAEEAGKPNVARIYYQMAARRASGDRKQQIAARLEAISPAKQGPKLAQDTP